MDQPFWTKLYANQSRSNGWVGFSPMTPKLLGVLTIPFPKCQPHKRLTITLLVSGLFSATTDFANSNRPLPIEYFGLDLPPMISMKLRGASSPFFLKSPRKATCISALPLSAKTWALPGFSGSLCFNESSSCLRFAICFLDSSSRDFSTSFLLTFNSLDLLSKKELRLLLVSFTAFCHELCVSITLCSPTLISTFLVFLKIPAKA